MKVPMGTTTGLALSQVVPHLDSICVLSPNLDILPVLLSDRGLCIGVVSNFARVEEARLARSLEG